MPLGMVLCLLLGLGSGDGPFITGDTRVAPYRLARLTVENSATEPQWIVFPFGQVDLVQSGKGLAFIAPPGEYQVAAIVPGSPPLLAVVRIEGGPGPAPPPGPTPGPEPAPPPVPVVTGKLFLSYIVDPAALDARQATIRVSSPLRSALGPLNTVWRTYQSDEDDISSLKFGPYLSGGLPALIIQASDGKVVRVLKDPDESTIIDVVSKIRNPGRK